MQITKGKSDDAHHWNVGLPCCRHPYGVRLACSQQRIAAAALASSTPDESLSLTRDDQRLLERALMASTEKVYDIATPAESARGGVVAKAADEMANVCKARASVIPPSRPA